jgi:hypothetical protein
MNRENIAVTHRLRTIRIGDVEHIGLSDLGEETGVGRRCDDARRGAGNRELMRRAVGVGGLPSAVAP